MSGFLLDTNLLSELRKQSRCDPGVRNWVESATAEDLFVSVLVLGEIRQGVERIRRRDQNQARSLEEWLQSLSTEFIDRILPVDERVADQWGRLGLRQPVPTVDALLAATALVHDLTVVSRDEDGFRNTGVRVINPFSKPKPVGNRR
ncbi:MAG: PIN domain-containing protein [Limisphaerales bacterium]